MFSTEDKIVNSKDTVQYFCNFEIKEVVLIINYMQSVMTSDISGMKVEMFMEVFVYHLFSLQQDLKVERAKQNKI